MENPTKILTEHPYASLFLAVFAEQVGLPFPGALFLLAAGAIAGLGTGSLGAFLASGVVATLLADLLWYAIGRRRRDSVRSLVEWLSPDPDGLARRVYRTFGERAERILVWAKFVPSLSTLTTPLAGATRMPLSRFVVFDGLGTLLWNGAFLSAGFLLGPEAIRLFHEKPNVGVGPALLALAGVAGFLAWRWARSPRPQTAEPALVPLDSTQAPL